MSQLMNLYAKDANRYKNLTRDEEQDLARRSQAGDRRAGHRLVMHNLRYAMKVAHEFKMWGHPLEDLVQEANIGMMMALRKFNPDRGVRFISYATWWVRAYIRNYLVRNASVARFGTTQRERSVYGKLGAVLARLTRENPSADEADLFTMAAEELSVGREELRLIHSRTRQGATLSLNRPLNDAVWAGDEKTTFQDRLEDPRPLADERLAAARDRQRVREALYVAARNPRERFIVEKRLLSDDPLTLDELGKRINSHISDEHLSRERVRQIEAGIVRRAAELLRAR